jgi:ubiquitin-like modifier-activating enzyme ATG7
VADLSNTLDGRYLMAQAVDLNLSLMKWRMWPELDTQKLAGTRCLLLGAGTLGKLICLL